MTRYIRTLQIFLVAGLALTVGATAWADDVIVELDEAKVFIEFNSTDTDFGIQFFWDGEPWRRMRVRTEDGETVLKVDADGNVREQGLTEGFFESAEPPASELSMTEFLARFPEGEYRFRGRSLEEDDDLVGEAEFTHILPAPPENLFPGEDELVERTGFMASFNPVTTDLDGNDLDIEFYELVVEKEDDEPILLVISVILLPTQTSVFVPGEFLEPDTEYKLEVIAQEESGNRTITEEGSFKTTSLLSVSSVPPGCVSPADLSFMIGVSPDDLSLFGFVIDTTLICEAVGTLTASAFEIVAPGGNVTFRSAERVVLGAGFQVNSSARFTAELGPVTLGGRFSSRHTN